MALTLGTRLGPCAITAPLGAGGMGEVYKAILMIKLGGGEDTAGARNLIVVQTWLESLKAGVPTN